MSNVMKRTIIPQCGPWRSVLFGILLLPFSGVKAQPGHTPPRPIVEISTELGIMVVALYNETPLHRDNFLELVREGAYDSLLFHRVIPGFMVQGGDPGSKDARRETMLGDGGPGYTVPAEIVTGLIHRKGALAAERQGDDVNPEKRSSGSQFYIVQGRTYNDQDLDRIAERSARLGQQVQYSVSDRMDYARDGGAPHLDGGYTVFGQVMTGLDVLDAIAALPCDNRDRPMQDLRMFMRILE